eukprot:2326854-Prorocentrum_lima.AAC.3
MLVDFVAHFNAATEATVLDMLQEKGFEYDKELSAAEEKARCVIQKRNEVAKQTKVLASMDKRKVAEESPASEDAASEPEPPEVRWTRIHPLAPIKRLVCDIHAPYHCMIIGAIVHGISVLE